MNSLDTFKKSILSKIKEIDTEYKQLYKDYIPTENEQKLISFLDDIWGLRFLDESLSDKFKSASIQLFFIDKDNKSYCYDKSFQLNKLHPKQAKTTPLYFLVARLAESKDYNFFLCPNIFVKTKKCLRHINSNIAASNCYFVDIDEVHTEKPVYNCTEKEILTYLYSEYPILKDIPPSYITMSGNGLHLYFTLTQTEYLFGSTYTNQTRLLHKNLTRNLITLFEADEVCSNFNRLMRTPYSTNTKYPIKTRFFSYQENHQHYSYELLNNIVLSALPIPILEVPVQKETSTIAPKTSTKKITKPKETVQRNYNTTPAERSIIASKARKKLFSDRQSDVEKWFYLHRKDMRGYRHNFFLIYSIILKELHNRSDYIENQCKRLNAKLLYPLTESELLKIIRQEHHYSFRNETIAEWLDFTQAEISTMSCHYGTEAIAESHREWNNYYNELRKEETRQKRERKQAQIFKIIAENPSATIIQLADLLNCSTATVSRWKRKYKEHLPTDR